MFKNTIICCITILLFYACNRVDKPNNMVSVNDSLQKMKLKQDSLNPVKKPDSEVYFDHTNTVIKEEFRDSLFAKFSNTVTDDKFTLIMPKGNINKTKTILQIFNHDGELIYENSFTTNYLINGYDLIYIKSDKELEKYILSRAKEMLTKDSFADISDKNETQKDDIFGQSEDMFQNYNVFIECQNEKRPLFSISLSEEDKTYIGYSKKIKKAVIIIGCC